MNMDYSERNESDILCITRSISHKGGYYSRKQRAQSSSVKLYCSLLCRYNVKLACDICICINDDTHKCELNTRDHKCDRNRLVLFKNNTTDDGDLLRKRPDGYNPHRTNCICEHLSANKPCPERHLCPYPHTDVERELWKEDYNDHTSIASLVYDIRERNSSLLFSVVIEYLSKKFSGTFKLICRSCYQESGEVVTKHHHVPWCQSSNCHWWGSSNKKLVFESSSAGRLISFDNVDEHGTEEQELVSCVKSLMSSVAIDVITAEAARLRQVDTHRSTKSRKVKKYDDDSECDDSYSENGRLAKTEEEIFDEDASNVLNVAAFDADTGDCLSKSGLKSRVKTDYYRMLTKQQTEDNSEAIYECGKIKLDGAFAGSCMIAGGRLNGCKVELRGRFNCGPAFDGDDVRVKVYRKGERTDSETDNSRTGNSSKFHGTVVKVEKRNVHRNARTFVCTIGKHDGHMTPLCGTAPKFHIIDSCLLKRYGPTKKDNYVAVYDSDRDGDLKLTKTVRLDLRRRREMLFVVKYLKWENKHKYPLGYVCRILHNSRTVEESRKILNLIHELPTNESKVSREEFVEQEELAEEEEEDAELVERKDLCNLLTVSVDAPCTKAIDDALSLEESDGKFAVWIHVADVTYYITEDVDVEAQRRVSFCSPHPRQPVLPNELVDKCSLLENKCQRAMTVHFELTADGEVLSKEGPLPSWIQNNMQYSYKDVQKIIDRDQAVDRGIEQMLIRLHKLASVLRRRRMGDGSQYYGYSQEHCFNREGANDLFETHQHHDAQRLVEEFMILTNQHVGEMLKDKCPHCTPFLVQNEPKRESLKKWKRNHGYIIPFSFHFSQFKQHLSAEHSSKATTPLLMSRHCWNALSAAVDEDEVRNVRAIIGSELLHPLHGIALASWFDIQEPSRYACYVDDGVHDTMHFGLQTRDYVHFTSPLRRYADIIPHRLLKADLAQQPPYTQDEVMALCEKMNERKSRQRLCDDDFGLHQVASMLQSPSYIPCYVETFDESGVCLICPYFLTDSQSARRLRLNFSEMTLHDNPVSRDDKLTLTWSKRYYDTRMSSTTNARPDAVTEYVLDSGMFGTTVLPHVWRSLHRAVKGQAERVIARVSEAMHVNSVMQPQEQVRGAAQETTSDIAANERPVNIAQEVTSEMAEDKPLVRHHVKFSCEITKGTVISVQFGAKAVKGFLQPVINLVNLTNDKDICVEHQRDPVSAFASVATKKTKDTYLNIEEYQNTWREILAMEAATNVVRNETVVLFRSHLADKMTEYTES